ncbi:MAG: hypothetical protein GX086_13485 [Alcaligenaceae bacterium]|nr:hypothetical protein [Alcaligenaceae bacterium]
MPEGSSANKNGINGARTGQVLKPSQAAALLGTLNQAREQLIMRRFEPGQGHTATPDTTRLKQGLDDTEALCLAAATEPDWSVAAIVATTPVTALKTQTLRP